MMKYFFSSLAMYILLFPVTGVSREGKNIVKFFPIADSVSEYPPLTAKLEIFCQKKISDLYVTLIGYKDGKKILIAAITKEKITDPDSEIYRVVGFENAEPHLGKVTTWGYVFDRNQDGRIDYFAQADAAAPLLDDRIPESYPIRGEKLGMPDLELYVGHCKIIFNHWADDNYDGKIDAAIHYDIDPLRDWVKRKIVIRCTKFNDKFNDVWAFTRRITGRRDSVAHTAGSVPYRPLGRISGRISPKTFAEITDILSLLNRAAAECGAGKSTFPSE